MMELDTVIPYLKKIRKVYDSHDTPFQLYWDYHFSTKNQQTLLYEEIQMQFVFWYIISNSFNFLSFQRQRLSILMISANKGYGVIIFVHEVNNKILSRDSNYITDVVMWPKFSHSSISKRDVIITSFLLGLLDQTVFFQRFSFKFNNLGLALDMALKTYTSVKKD